MKKLLYNIEPFNDINYNTCFYNSLFAVLRYYKTDILSIIVNSIPTYYYNSNEKNFGIKYVNIQNEKDILTKLNIDLIDLPDNLDVIEFIVNAIDNNNPIIANIDWYYMDNQKTTYKKIHRFHTILIVGYNNKDKKLKIFDQQFIDTLTYSICEIPYQCLVDAYDGYLNMFNIAKGKGMLQVFKSNKESPLYKNYAQLYYKNILNKCVWTERVAVLNQIYNNMENIFSNTFEHKKIDNLNNIVNHKRVEKFVCEAINEVDDKILNEISNTIKLWELIRNKTYKASFFNNKSEKIIAEVKIIIQDIINCEEIILGKLIY